MINPAKGSVEISQNFWFIPRREFVKGLGNLQKPNLYTGFAVIGDFAQGTIGKAKDKALTIIAIIMLLFSVLSIFESVILLFFMFSYKLC